MVTAAAFGDIVVFALGRPEGLEMRRFAVPGNLILRAESERSGPTGLNFDGW